MKTNITLAINLLVLLVACATYPTAQLTVDISVSQTLTYETAIDDVTETATANTSTATRKPTATDLSTATPLPTHTPLPELLPSAIDLQWITAYGLHGNQFVTKIRPTKDGGFILVGNTVAKPLGDTALLFKLRADGLLVWQKSLGQVTALDVLETSAGDFILAGDLHWIKFDSQGNLLWQHTFGESPYHTGPIIRLVEESNGNVVVKAIGSRSVFNTDGELQSFTEDATHSDSQMTPQEARERFQLDENLFDYVFFVQKTADGGALVGNAFYEDYGLVAIWLSHIFISRFSEDGSMRWQRGSGGYLGASYEDFHAFESKSGDIIVAGTLVYYTSNVYRNDVWVFRLDGDGNTRWTRIYATEGPDAVTIIQELPNGDLLFAGQTSGAETGGQDMWVLKTNAQGEIPNCGLMLDGSAGLYSYFPEVETPAPEAEQRFFGTANAQAIPLCSVSP